MTEGKPTGWRVIMDDNKPNFLHEEAPQRLQEEMPANWMSMGQPDALLAYMHSLSPSCRNAWSTAKELWDRLPKDMQNKLGTRSNISSVLTRLRRSGWVSARPYAKKTGGRSATLYKFREEKGDLPPTWSNAASSMSVRMGL